MAIRLSHEMYQNCFEMSRFKGSKFLVINFVFGFFLQMNIYVRLGLYINDFFVIYVIILLLA
jgi:hypothetical protein